MPKKQQITPIKVLPWGEKVFYEFPIYKFRNQMYARFGETNDDRKYVEVSKFGPLPESAGKEGFYSQRLRLYKPHHWVKLKYIFENELFPMIGWRVEAIESEVESAIKSLNKKLKSKEGILQETSRVIKELTDKKTRLKEDILSLEKLRSESNIAVITDRLNELTRRMGKRLPETRGKNSWQSWIYKNNWLFGINYLTPIEKTRVGFNNIPDFLFPTIDGFLDIMEIKLPSMDVINEDSQHPGSYRWSGDANKAIGQVVNYLHNIELHQLELAQKIKREYNLEISTIKPRGFILIGKNVGWREEKKEALRKLNFSLHGIEVLTYSGLQQRAREIIQIYSKDLTT